MAEQAGVDGMILAAGLGTRLRPLTDDRPKALVTIRGQAMLGRVAERMIAAGVDHLVINTHHFADQVVAYVEAHAETWGVPVRISREVDAPLETGGGLWFAREHFRGDRPILVHNVDVVSNADLGDLVATHRATGARATLAVKQRETTRRLLFDARGLLGRQDDTRDFEVRAREAVGDVEGWPFSGIHIVEPALLATFEREGAYSILEPYLAAAEAGARLLPWPMNDAAWYDMGKPEGLAWAEAFIARHA